MMREKNKRNGKTTPTTGTQTNSLDVKTLKGDTMSNSNVKNINEITTTLSEVVPEIITEINGRLSIIAKQFNQDNFDEIFLGNDQETQDCTKLFQGIASACIETVCVRNNVPLNLKEVDGADWVYGKNEELPLEQKIRSFLGRSKKFHKNLKGYGLPCQSWTGNKHSVYNGKKTDLHLLWSFKIEKNEVTDCVGLIVSLGLTDSKWKTGSGNKDSYATLRINNNYTHEGIGVIYGSLRSTNQYVYGLLESVNVNHNHWSI